MNRRPSAEWLSSASQPIRPGGVRQVRSSRRRSLSSEERPSTGSSLSGALWGAMPAVDPRPVGAQPEGVAAAGDQVALAVQGGHPEAVDHVARRQLQEDRPADRDVDLVGREHPLAGARVGVVHLPPPLVADHLEGHRLTRQRRGGPPGGDARHQQDEQEDHRDPGRRRHRPGHAAVRLRCGRPRQEGVQVLVSAAPAEERQEQGRQEDRRADPEHQPPEIFDARGQRTGGIEHRLESACPQVRSHCGCSARARPGSSSLCRYCSDSPG